ncbi:MAG: hypothetical protein SPH30_02730 [Prevotella sp.]|nr:hypothetical protein [Prevotella sp.]
MLKIFNQYLLAKVIEIFPGVDMKSRLKRFVFAFIVVLAKWVRVARQWTLNIYTKDRWLHYRTIFNASTDEPNVLEGLSFVTPNGGKRA